MFGWGFIALIILSFIVNLLLPIKGIIAKIKLKSIKNKLLKARNEANYRKGLILI